MKAFYSLKPIGIAILVAGSLCLPWPGRLLAQGPGDEPDPAFGLAPSGETRAQDITWEELDYADLELTAGNARQWIYFYLPGDVTFVPGSYLTLVVSHTGAQVEQPSTLTVELNDHVLDIIQLTVEIDNRGQVRVDIPPEYLRTGRNRLVVSLKTAWDPCRRDSLSTDALLHSEGFFHLEYEIIPREPDLSLYPVPFYERTFEPSVVYFVLPDVPTPQDTTVAATIAAGLGRYSSGEVEIRSVTPPELSDEILANHNLIAIGRPGTNTFFSQLSLPLSLAGADFTDEQGILQEITSPWNPRRMILIVTGATDAGMTKAGMALNRQVSFPGFKGQIAIVEELFETSEEEVGSLSVDRTFEELGYGDTVVYGTRPTTERFYFYLPRAWQMSESASLQLFFTHSDVLTGTVSTLDVRLNGVPVASTLLDRSNARDGSLEVELFSWLLQSDSNRVEIVVDMSTGVDECLYWTSHQAWTVIGRSSFLHLPYEPLPLTLDLENLFWPFSEESDLSGTTIVLPETMSQAEQDVLLNLSARLGALAGGKSIVLETVQASGLSSELKRTQHILAIGLPSANPLIREINEFLPQPFLPDSDEPVQIHNLAVIAFDPQRSIGFVQLLASPWNPDKACLVITGTDREGVMAAFDLLVNSAGSLQGDLAMVEGENLTTMDTRPLELSQEEEGLQAVRPDTSVLVAQAERWW